MDNQQETTSKVSPFEFGWFCGFFDGEGSLGITVRRRKEHKKYYEGFKPHLQVCNTEIELVERCKYFFDALGIPYYVSYYKGKGKRKPHWNIAVAGLRRVMKILPIIKPGLQGNKKEKADLMMEFCNSRLSKWHRSEYSQRERQIVDRMFELNQRGKRSDPQRLYAKPLEIE